MEVSWIALTILLLCLLAASINTTNEASLLITGLGSFILVSSLAATLSLLLGSEYLKPAAFSLAMILFVLNSGVSLAKRRKPIFAHLIWAVGLSLGALILDLVTRSYGLASSAFTDGQTIIAMAQGFQQGEFEGLTGTHAMKRGFGLPSMLALGPESEYFAGLMPIFFLAALFMTWQLSKSLTTNIRQATGVMVVIVTISLTTEAITRHAYLVNTHAIAWLLFATSLNYLVIASKRKLEGSEVLVILAVSASIGFLRLDYIILFAPMTLTLALVLANYRKTLTVLLVGIQGLSAAIWTSLAVKDFPVFSDFGPLLVFSGSVIVGVLIAYAHNRGMRVETLSKSFFTWFSVAILTLTFISSDFTEAFHDLSINLFFGEGLWGLSIFFILGIVVYAVVFTHPNSGYISKTVLNVFLLSLSLYLASKYLDGSSTGKGAPNLIRIGFGDSFNRTLVSWLPFIVLPLAKLFNTFRLKK